MYNLCEGKCTPCTNGAPAITDKELEEYKKQIPDWDLIEENGIKKIRRNFKFKNFKEALKFTKSVGKIAEEMKHHPTILTEWGKVEVTWWTHKINGLHRNDLIMAFKTDELLNPVKFFKF